MSREQYQVPSGSPTTDNGSFKVATRDYTGASGENTMHYLCGDCAARVPLDKGAPIRCQRCGGRVLYKERTKRMVQFEAR